MYNRIIKFIGVDKILHFSIAMNITFLLGWEIALILSILKELYDQWSYGGFSIKDLIADLLGIGLTLIVQNYGC